MTVRKDIVLSEIYRKIQNCYDVDDIRNNIEFLDLDDAIAYRINEDDDFRVWGVVIYTIKRWK